MDEQDNDVLAELRSVLRELTWMTMARRALFICTAVLVGVLSLHSLMPLHTAAGSLSLWGVFLAVSSLAWAVSALITCNLQLLSTPDEHFQRMDPSRWYGNSY